MNQRSEHQRAVVERPIDELRPSSRNARTHSPQQIKQISASIRAFGFINPILIDESDAVLAGHGRLAAARDLGLKTVPTLIASGLNGAQKRAYVLADNKLAEKAGWDRQMLAAELGELAILLPKFTIEWDIEVTGFAPGEVEILTHDHAVDPHSSDDVLPRIRRTAISAPGELWHLGRHRLLCGDARSADDLDRLMNRQQAKMIFTDPPYNVRIGGHVTRTKAHPEFAMGSGEMDAASFREFLSTCLSNVARVSTGGALHYICMDWRHIALLIDLSESIYNEMLNLVVWNKGTAGQGSFYRSQHELIGVFNVSDGTYQNNISLGQFGRNRANVWNYASVAGRRASKTLHPTIKPVNLVVDAIRDCTFRGDIILDPFLGSGTTLVAAEKVGRICYSMEIDPVYVDRVISRWQDYTGGTAVRESDGATISELSLRHQPT